MRNPIFTVTRSAVRLAFREPLWRRTMEIPKAGSSWTTTLQLSSCDPAYRSYFHMTTEPPVTSITQNTLTLCLRYGEFAMTVVKL
jgi:hypothetical protein